MALLRPIFLLVMSLCVWQIAAASSDAGTLLVGVRYETICSITHQPLPYLYGFSTALSLQAGSYSPTGLTGGEIVANLFDFYSCGPQSELTISGFSTNPGQNWLSSVTCIGVTNTSSSTFEYAYSSGTASWAWNSRFGFSSHNGSNVGCTIVHN